MNTECAHVGWRFWLWWMWASTVGLAIGLAVGIFAWAMISPIIDYYYGLSDVGEALMLAVGGALCGGLLGIAQRRVLQRPAHHSSAGGWRLALQAGLWAGLQPCLWMEPRYLPWSLPWAVLRSG